MTLVDACMRLGPKLPDPGQPTFMALCAGFGAFIGGVTAMRRSGRDHVGTGMAEGSLVGYGAGFVVWALVVAMNLL